ncbi:MAG: UPF0104 family protein, partial [Planctomycetales bacterium]|nr:UPF0104 family protein [Planctomycetales bacterium]
SEIQLRWLAFSGVCYFSGMLPMGSYWHYVLGALGQRTPWPRTMVAYYTGHLGKYVPGKAMVVVIRTALLKTETTRTTLIAVSVFIETFMMMAVGAGLATALIAWQFSQHHFLLVLGIALTALSSIPTWPPLVRQAVKILKLAKDDTEVEAALDGYTWQVMVVGWISELSGWVLIGFSLWCVMCALPLSPPLDSAWSLWPRLTASTSLSMVAGFLSLLPGGLGVRELVLNELLKPQFGAVVAPLAAVLLRAVWLVTELIVSSILYLGWRLTQR